MKIACLGWGSLIWNPGGLKIQKDWFIDGPTLPVEFTRISDNKRVTLIVDSKADLRLTVLWALMSVGELQEARRSLMERENIKAAELIHFKTTTVDDQVGGDMVRWLKSKQLDAAIWTGLSYNKKYFGGERPSIQQVCDHIDSLSGEERTVAEEYIRKAPRQIDTLYRREIEKRFGWTALN